MTGVEAADKHRVVHRVDFRGRGRERCTAEGVPAVADEFDATAWKLDVEPEEDVIEMIDFTTEAHAVGAGFSGAAARTETPDLEWDWLRCPQTGSMHDSGCAGTVAGKVAARIDRVMNRTASIGASVGLPPPHAVAQTSVAVGGC